MDRQRRLSIKETVLVLFGTLLLFWSNSEVASRSPASWQKGVDGILAGDQTFFFLISIGLSYFLGRSLYRLAGHFAAERPPTHRLSFGLALLAASLAFFYMAILGAEAAHATRIAEIGEQYYRPSLLNPYIVGYWAKSWPLWVGVAFFCMGIGYLFSRDKKPQP